MIGKRTLLWVALLGILLGGCQEDSENYLEGSVTDAYNMKFDFVRIRLYSTSAMSIEYVRRGDAGETIPLRVTIDKPVAQLNSSMQFSIVTDGTISRGVGYDSSPLPTLDSGIIYLDTFKNEDGSTVDGRFDAVFTGTTGSKISLRGGFSGDLEIVE